MTNVNSATPAVIKVPDILTKLNSIATSSHTPLRGRAIFTSWLRSTPGTMMRSFSLLAFFSVMVFITQGMVISRIHDTVETIGISTKPSIVAAERMSSTLANMDAEASNDVIASDYPAIGTGIEFREANLLFGRLMVEASRNITFAATEVPAMEDITHLIGMYEESLGETRSMSFSSPWTALQRMKWSSRINRDFIAPAISALEIANYRPLDEAYKSYIKWYIPSVIIGGGAGIGLLASMIFVQIRLSRRTNRILNGPLVAASIILLSAQVFFTYAVFKEHSSVVTAKIDAFDSIKSLYDAKVATYRLRADDALWLLDPSTRDETTRSFKDNANKILVIPDYSNISIRALTSRLEEAYNMEVKGDSNRALSTTGKIGGFLGEELGNITFGAEERRGATDSVELYLGYLKIHNMIRILEEAGYHREAVLLNLGNNSGASTTEDVEATLRKAITSRDITSISKIVNNISQGKRVFSEMDSAINRTIEVNDNVFNVKIKSALDMIAIMPWISLSSLIVSLLMSGLGLWTRYRAYV